MIQSLFKESQVILILMLLLNGVRIEVVQAELDPVNSSFTPLPSRSTNWVKYGMVVAQTEPWEETYIQNFTSPAEPLDGDRWRIWYSAGMPMTIAIAEGIPGEKMAKYRAVLSPGEPADAPLSIGNLPEGWQPTQPVHIKLKDGGHRLYFWAHYPKQSIVRYLVAESTDGKRYRVVDPSRPCLYHVYDRAVEFIGTTPSGLKLHDKTLPGPFHRTNVIRRPENEPAAPAELICNDATTVYQLPDGSFELYTATVLTVEKDDSRWAYNDNAPGLIRVIDRMVSDDGLTWTGRQRVLEPDKDDPSDLQFYHLAVTYTYRGRVGMLGRYRVKDQTQDLEWCFSTDGVNWVRPDRKAWLERGWPGKGIDSFGIYPPTSMVFHDDTWWLFYTGTNSSHNGKFIHGEGKKRSAIYLAKAKSIWSEVNGDN